MAAGIFQDSHENTVSIEGRSRRRATLVEHDGNQFIQPHHFDTWNVSQRVTQYGRRCLCEYAGFRLMRHLENRPPCEKKVDRHFIPACGIEGVTRSAWRRELSCASRVGRETQEILRVKCIAHLCRASQAASASGVSISVSGPSSGASTSQTISSFSAIRCFAPTSPAMPRRVAKKRRPQSTGLPRLPPLVATQISQFSSGSNA